MRDLTKYDWTNEYKFVFQMLFISLEHISSILHEKKQK